MTQQQVAAITDVLARHEVVHVLIGGMAGQLHGIPIPATRDVDITPATTSENLQRLATALREMKAVVAYRGEGIPVDVPITAELLGNMVSMQFVTDHGPLDVNLRPDGTAGYDDLALNSLVVDVLGRDVRLAAAEDLIRSKQAAGRPKDLEVLPTYLRWLRQR